jgi:hypothetical protein
LFHECFNSLPGCHAFSDSEVFHMNSQSADSLDGRYFWVMPTATIIGKAVSLWTGWEDDLAAPEQPFVQVVWPTKLEEQHLTMTENHSDPPIR